MFDFSFSRWQGKVLFTGKHNMALDIPVPSASETKDGQEDVSITKCIGT